MDYTKPRGYLTNIRRLILLFRDPSETIKINPIKSEEKIMKTEIISKYQDSILPERGKENCVKLNMFLDILGEAPLILLLDIGSFYSLFYFKITNKAPIN